MLITCASVGPIRVQKSLSISVPRLSVSEARLSINVATLSISFLYCLLE